MLTEGLLLAAAGGLGGVLVARWSAGLLMSFLPPMDTPLRLPLDVDARVLFFTAAVTMLTGVVFALAPALQGSRADVATALKEEAGQRRSRRKALLRNALVVGQVALSVVLLVGGGALPPEPAARAAVGPRLRDATNILLASMDLFPQGYTRTPGSSSSSSCSRGASSCPA